MMNLYLRNNTFYYRKSIPKTLKFYFNNKSLYIRTLKTSSKRLANKYVTILNKKFETIIGVYKMGLDIELVNQLVEEFHNTQLEITERDLRNIPNPEDTLFALGLEDMIKQYQINYQEGVYEKEEIDLIVSKLPNKPLEEDLSEIGKILLESKINHLKAIYTNINNGYYNKALKTIHKPQAKAIESKEVKTISMLKEDFIKYQSRLDNWSEDNTQLAHRTFNMLNLYFNNKPIHEIKLNDLMDFRDTMQEIPTKLTTYKEFENKSLDYILENSEDYDNLTNSTINKYINKANQFLKWAYQEDYLHKKDFIIPKFPNDTKSRLPYANEEIQAIKELVSQDQNKEINFITLVATYQGMRLKEITQLRKEDIITTNNIPCISINTNEDKTTKTIKSIRTIPIHPKLIELGFLDYVNSKENNLFNINNKDFSSYYRRNYKNLINPSKTFYSLRHSFIDALKQSNQNIEHIQAFVGHSHNAKTTFGYGSPLNTKLLKGLLEHINY